MLYRDSILKASSAIFGINLAGKILGFVGSVLVAGYFGARSATDAYYVSEIIPNLITPFFVIGFDAFLPIYTKYKINHGEAEANKFASVLGNLSSVAIIVWIAIAVLFSPFIVKIIAPGLKSGTYQLSVGMTRWMMPMILACFIIGITKNILYSANKFVLAGFYAVVSPLSTILCILCLKNVIAVYCLVAGVLVANYFQAVMQSAVVMKKRFAYSFSFDFRHPGLKEIWLVVLPLLFGTVLGKLGGIINQMMASVLNEGSIASLGFAMKIYRMPQELIVFALPVVLFPVMSEQFSREKLSEMKESVLFGIKMSVMAILPLQAFLIVFSEQAVRLFFERGQFDGTATFITSGVLKYYILGIVFDCFIVMFIKTFYVIKKTAYLAFAGAVCVGVNVVLNLIFIYLVFTPENNSAASGLALSTTISMFVLTVLLYFYIDRKLNGLDHAKLFLPIIKGVASAFIAGLIYFYLYGLLKFIDSGSAYLELLKLAITGVAGFCAYVVLLKILKVEEIENILKKAIRR